MWIEHTLHDSFYRETVVTTLLWERKTGESLIHDQECSLLILNNTIQSKFYSCLKWENRDLFDAGILNDDEYKSQEIDIWPVDFESSMNLAISTWNNDEFGSLFYFIWNYHHHLAPSFFFHLFIYLFIWVPSSLFGIIFIISPFFFFIWNYYRFGSYF